MHPPEWQAMLQQAQNNGVYPLPAGSRAALAQAAASAGLVFHAVPLDDCPDEPAALAAIGKAMGFPEWYGGNRDALYDCLTDLSWQDSAATVLVLTGGDAPLAMQPARWASLREVFATAAEYWRDEETPFFVFVERRADSPPAAGASHR